MRSIRSVPTDEFGNLLDHLFLDAGIAVLGKGAAWVGRHRMTMLERAPCLVGSRDLGEQRCRAGRRTERAVKVGCVPVVRTVTGEVRTTPRSPASAGRKPAAVTPEMLPLLVPTTQTGLPQRFCAALVKPCNSAACVALRRIADVRPVGCAGVASAIMTLRP